jgi:peptidoglycan-associated lipoprotein
MRLKFFTLIAAVIVLAACASEPEESTATSSKGAAVDSGSGIGASTTALPTKSDLTSEARDTVVKVATWMQSYPDVTLTLEGHADERGTREYNLALGERRANSVRSYMEALGIDGSRLSVISYGYDQPAVLGSNELTWTKNRRAAFVVNSLPRVNANSAQSQ